LQPDDLVARGLVTSSQPRFLARSSRSVHLPNPIWQEKVLISAYLWHTCRFDLWADHGGVTLRAHAPWMRAAACQARQCDGLLVSFSCPTVPRL